MSEEAVTEEAATEETSQQEEQIAMNKTTTKTRTFAGLYQR